VITRCPKTHAHLKLTEADSCKW